MGKSRGKNSNYKYAPATSSVVEKKESGKAAFFSIIVAVLAIVVCVAVAVAMHQKKDITYVEMKVKDYGTIVLKLDREAAPETVDNFVDLVENGFYDGLTFHRVMDNFMIQGGCPNGDGRGNSGKYIKGEFSANGYDNPISHKRGVISMARSDDGNPFTTDDFNSASCQFFICNEDSTFLDGNYAAFGHVVEGLDVVDSITYATVGYSDANGAINDKSKQAVIEYVKVLDGYTESAE